jgi:hypothetical protein
VARGRASTECQNTRTRNGGGNNVTPSVCRPMGLRGCCLVGRWAGVHRLLGPCEGRQSWRRPNDTQSVTSNCNTHDPVTRRLHRQHLVHPQFVRAWMWSKVGFVSWNLLFSQMGPRWAGSGPHEPVRERALGSPTHPLAHRGALRRRAGRGSSAPPLEGPPST